MAGLWGKFVYFLAGVFMWFLYHTLGYCNYYPHTKGVADNFCHNLLFIKPNFLHSAVVSIIEKFLINPGNPITFLHLRLDIRIYSSILTGIHVNVLLELSSLHFACFVLVGVERPLCPVVTLSQNAVTCFLVSN